MSKVKHFLRKLHIGDHHQHSHHQQQQVPSVDSSPQTTPSSNLNRTASSSENENSTHNNDEDSFNFLEEEYQMQLALAISVSDQSQTCVDSETDVINATKQISLGISPSQSVAESLSLQYWSYNVVNYDEKVMDGFYDVCGIDSNLLVQAKMPTLEDLKAVSVRDNVGYDVVLVNRTSDVELRKLEEIVHFMSMEFRSLHGGLNTSFLVQKIANLVVERMGGPVSNVEEMFQRCRARNNELRIYLNTITLPLGCLDVGHSRQRALLFKVLADRINLACKLVKGSYYTGTDEGAVNLIKLDDGSEFIIDLMGAPGALIPTEVASSDQSFGLDTISKGVVATVDKSACSTSDKGARTRLLSSIADESGKNRTLSSHLAAPTDESNSERRATKKILIELSGHDTGDFYLPSGGVAGGPSDARKQKSRIPHIEDVPTFSDELPIMGQRERNVLTRDRNDRVIPYSDSGFGCELVHSFGGREAMDVAEPDQSNADVIQNMQMDPVLNKVAEILWEDLQIGERIGIGSYGEVYRAEWNGTEVAVKKFMKQDISGDALAQFKCEIEIMSRLRHPNIVLFMGAVTRPPNLSILTEYLPRGSLFKLLHRQNTQIDEKRRIKMALDVAKGMNYLHTSHPTIVHRDLKTPNLLVDKNWAVKVCDFGMSRLQHHTFLSSKSTAGTAEWMAPEVLRNEPSNEKSDVYSFGVILWELSTMQVPWTGLNSMQVVGAVGFQGRHLNIPPTVNPLVAQIITECWNRNPLARPSFAEIITRLKCLNHLNLETMESRAM